MDYLRNYRAGVGLYSGSDVESPLDGPRRSDRRNNQHHIRHSRANCVANELSLWTSGCGRSGTALHIFLVPGISTKVTIHQHSVTTSPFLRDSGRILASASI